ncbi:glycosyltransferase family 4 protein [Actinomadura sp. NAK00032]|uniref:glycosyltransferase family 4 protein n=1 Tax=Actinomadura sp. NAK00032 TaxID=2742128 RepID=UPI0020C7BAB0|nr:glycosyltransferase family 4 protein [Actinomadura sp. NAK00032]
MNEPARPLRLRRRVRRRAHRVLRRAALLALRPLRWRRPAADHRRGDRLRVRVLLQNAHGTGGTIRTVLNLCGHLARDHDVEIVSALKGSEKAFYPLPAGVAVTYADDRFARPGRPARLLGRLPSLLVPADEASFRHMTLWTDVRLVRALYGTPADVLIGTRPSLVLLAAELAPRGVAVIGQDHMNLGSYQPALRSQVVRGYRRLTVLATLTEAARTDYARALAGTGVRIARIPNAAPPLPGPPSRREDKVVLAAGRLVRTKGFDLLMRAFAPIAAEYPDWTLRIFGSGARRDRLLALIGELGLTGRVELRPRTADLPAEMRRASVYALSSRREGMPMVVIEAMGMGLPVVSFDCPHGPAELIADGADGLLVANGDVDALTAALRKLISDPALRDRLGERALRSVRRHDLDHIGARWSRLIAAAADGRPGPLPRPWIRRPGPGRNTGRCE